MTLEDFVDDIISIFWEIKKQNLFASGKDLHEIL